MNSSFTNTLDLQNEEIEKNIQILLLKCSWHRVFVIYGTKVDFSILFIGSINGFHMGEKKPMLIFISKSYHLCPL